MANPIVPVLAETALDSPALTKVAIGGCVRGNPSHGPTAELEQLDLAFVGVEALGRHRCQADVPLQGLEEVLMAADADGFHASWVQANGLRKAQPSLRVTNVTPGHPEGLASDPQNQRLEERKISRPRPGAAGPAQLDFIGCPGLFGG